MRACFHSTRFDASKKLTCQFFVVVLSYLYRSRIVISITSVIVECVLVSSDRSRIAIVVTALVCAVWLLKESGFVSATQSRLVISGRQQQLERRMLLVEQDCACCRTGSDVTLLCCDWLCLLATKIAALSYVHFTRQTLSVQYC